MEVMLKQKKYLKIMKVVSGKIFIVKYKKTPETFIRTIDTKIGLVAQKVEHLKLGRAVHRKNWPSSSESRMQER